MRWRDGYGLVTFKINLRMVETFLNQSLVFSVTNTVVIPIQMKIGMRIAQWRKMTTIVKIRQMKKPSAHLIKSLPLIL